MKRYVFYDRKTGEILHTHQTFKLGSESPVSVSKKELESIAQRMVHTKSPGNKGVSSRPVSSRRVLRSISPKTGRLVTKKISEDYWTREDAEDQDIRGPARGGR